MTEQTSAEGWRIWVERDLWRSSLSLNAKAVYTVLRGYADGAGVCWPSLATIGKELGVSRNTVIRALRELERSNLLAVEGRRSDKGQESNLYRLKGYQSATLPTPMPQVNRGGATDEHPHATDEPPLFTGGMGPMPQGHGPHATGEHEVNPRKKIQGRRPKEENPSCGADAPAPSRREPAHAEQFQAILDGQNKTRKALTKNEIGQANEAAKQLDEAGYRREEILAMCRNWPGWFPGATITFMAIASHASTLMNSPPARASPNGYRAKPVKPMSEGEEASLNALRAEFQHTSA